tara:strand:+ start:12713 stop:13372 length:660 start_codon:yes stop_codon:yes gene_type:complete
MIGFLAIGHTMLKKHLQRQRETWRKIRMSRVKQEEARRDLTRFSNIFEGTTVSNPYSNLTNPFADLKLDLTKQAEFSRDQFQQNQANMIGGIAGSSGTSGMANKVKLLSQMGMEAAQKSASSIQNINPYSAQAAARIDNLKRSGRNVTALFDAKKYATLMDMEKLKRAGYEDQIKKDKGIREEANARWQALMGQMASIGGGSTNVSNSPTANYGNITTT